MRDTNIVKEVTWYETCHVRRKTETPGNQRLPIRERNSPSRPSIHPMSWITVIWSIFAGSSALLPDLLHLSIGLKDRVGAGAHPVGDVPEYCGRFRQPEASGPVVRPAMPGRGESLSPFLYPNLLKVPLRHELS